MSDSSQTSFIDKLDEYIGANDPLLPYDVDVLEDYIVKTPLLQHAPFAVSAFAGKFSKRKQIISAAVLCTLFAADIICCILFGFNSGTGVGWKA